MRLLVMDVRIVPVPGVWAPMCVLVVPGVPSGPDPHQTVERDGPSLSQVVTGNLASSLKHNPSLRLVLKLWEKLGKAHEL
jgi:hypothetical protein